MKQYLDLIKTVLEKGTYKGDRTGTGTISYFGYQMRFDLSDGFPLLTTKKVYLRAIIQKLVNRPLQEHCRRISWSCPRSSRTCGER